MFKLIYSSIIILSSVFILFSSCDDNNDFRNHVEFGPMMAKPDSFYYTCFKCVPSLETCVFIRGNAGYNTYNDGFGLALYNYSDTAYWKELEWWAYLKEMMGMYYCQLELGKIIVENKDVVLEDCERGIGSHHKLLEDIPIASYTMDTNQVSWVEVTAIDSAKGVIEGKFEFHFLLKQEDEGAGFAKKITYNHGEFRAKNY